MYLAQQSHLIPARTLKYYLWLFSVTSIIHDHCYFLGFPILGVEWQKMENPDLRISMGMKSDQKGVRVRRVDPTAPESKVLRPSDVILSFDRVDIANDGTGKNSSSSSGTILLCPFKNYLCMHVLYRFVLFKYANRFRWTYLQATSLSLLRC